MATNNVFSNDKGPQTQGTGPMFQTSVEAANMCGAARAEKSGFAAEAFDKVQSKYDSRLASSLMRWIADVTGQHLNTAGDVNNFVMTLRDGVVLCNLANALRPGSVPKVNRSNMAFKQMENINSFLTFAEKTAGIPKQETFMTVDLYEGQNPSTVLCCLSALARKANKYGKQSLGPKEATGQQRTWTAEQLRAGEGIIPLQAGTNKGANASGINMGKSRHICDNPPTEHQKAGEAFIPLQSGTNKGANASGINMGKTRQICD